MLATLVESFLLGFAITAVPGAILFETIRRVLHKSTTVISFLAGNFCGMLVIMLAAFLGLSEMQSDSASAKILYATSGLLLVYIGVSSMFIQKKDLGVSKMSKKRSKYSGFLTGFVLAIANPVSIAFWISLSAKLLKDTGSTGLAILSCVSVMLGALLLFIVLVWLVKILKVKIKTHHLLVLSHSFGALILAYGLFTLSHVLR